MTKTYNFNFIDGEYLLVYSQPGKEGEPFSIDATLMEFNTIKFYEYVFQDMTERIDIKIVNQMNQDEMDSSAYKKGLRVLQTIEDLCEKISQGINEKCFSSDKLS